MHGHWNPFYVGTSLSIGVIGCPPTFCAHFLFSTHYYVFWIFDMTRSRSQSLTMLSTFRIWNNENLFSLIYVRHVSFANFNADHIFKTNFKFLAWNVTFALQAHVRKGPLIMQEEELVFSSSSLQGQQCCRCWQDDDMQTYSNGLVVRKQRRSIVTKVAAIGFQFVTSRSDLKCPWHNVWAP